VRVEVRVRCEGYLKLRVQIRGIYIHKYLQYGFRVKLGG
jgi:hypothetical protein